MGQSNFLEKAMAFWEKLLLAPGDKFAKLAESSEMTAQRNSLRGCNS
jgi:hypothetical protein